MYGNNIVVDTDLFEGMYPLLEELEAQQIPWGIVTNKPRGLSESLLQKLNLTERCAVLVCRKMFLKRNQTRNRCIWLQSG